MCSKSPSGCRLLPEEVALMGDDSRFDIPDACREFGEANFDERWQVAKRFVERFV